MKAAAATIFGLFLTAFLAGAGAGAAEEQGALPSRVTTRDGATMVAIPGGPFLMGSPEEEGLPPEFPKHEVNVDPFYLDASEVTNGRYAEFLNEIKAPEGKDGEVWTWVVLRSDLQYPERAQWWPTEISFKHGKYVPTPGREDHPLITISWHGAKAYCEYYGKRMPREAEWEKAARGGLEGKRFPWGDAYPTTGGATFERRWLSNADPVPTTAVGSYAPNAYGLYDMAGNVWEWCEDGYDPEYYKKSPGKNPPGGQDQYRKVLRGGSWFNPVQFIRVSQRNFGHADGNQDAIGFRCAMDGSAEAVKTAGAVPASEPAVSSPATAGTGRAVNGTPGSAAGSGKPTGNGKSAPAAPEP